MQNDISVMVVGAVVLGVMLAVLSYFVFIFCWIIDIILYRWYVKRLFLALENVAISYSKSNNFDHAVSELESVIEMIVRRNKNFPVECRSIGGLLTYYIHCLNTGKVTRISSDTNIIELKSTAHDLINKYKTVPFSSETKLYCEPLVNEIAKSLAAKDMENGQRQLSELDAQILKLRKRGKFTYTWLPPIATIIGAVVAAILGRLIS